MTLADIRLQAYIQAKDLFRNETKFSLETSEPEAVNKAAIKEAKKIERYILTGK